MSKLISALGLAIALNTYSSARLIARWPWAAQHFVLVSICTLLFAMLQLVGPIGDHVLFPALRRAGTPEVVLTIVDFISYVALGVMSCLFIYTLGLDFVTLVWKLGGHPLSTVNFDRRAVLLLGVATVSTTALGIGQAVVGPEVRKVEIPLKNLPAAFDGFTIAQISDLHVGPLIGRDYTAHVVKMTNDLKPDLIALTGDFVDGTVADLRDEVAPLAELTAPYGKFYITGNHEYYWGAGPWLEEFSRLGAQVMVNEHKIIERDGSQILLAGVTDYSTHNMDSPQATSPKQALVGAPEGLIKILLAHQPASYAMAYEAGFNLQISGHTHAGQYFPFNLFIGLFQRYYKGLNRHEDMWVYVNRGTGYWGPPMRTGVPSEITLITLKRA